jgi:hypothetical protein
VLDTVRSSATAAGLLSISVRGSWRNRGDLVENITANSRDFLLGGEELFNRRSRYRFSLRCERSEAGFKLTCSSFERSLRGARELQHAGTALLCSGGSSIMVDSTRLTHTPEGWVQLDHSGRTLDIYAAYVRFLASPKAYGSFGMHNFGLPDVRMPANVGLVEASRTTSAFNLYVLIEKPQLATGHTFCAGDDAPRFRLQRIERSPTDDDVSQPNPEGLWSLTPTGR